MRIAVLGCGPAGLMAAHAVAVNNHEPMIFSKKMQSSIGGAQYLHMPIPGINKPHPDGKVNFIKYGNERGYAKKVYGDPTAITSWYDYEEGYHEIWNLRATYGKLWRKYEERITDLKLDFATVQSLLRSFPVVLSTVPLLAICGEDHYFESQEVWIVYGQAKEGGEDRIIYDGTDDFPWYRWSYIFGWQGIEYSQATGTNQPSQHVRKPLCHTCDCHQGLVKLGRYGAWQKGILTHHAYEGAVDAVQQLQ